MTNRIMKQTIAAAVLALAFTVPAVAQQTNPSAPSIGMAGNYTVMARGLSSMAWNPAGLGMPGSPGFSIAVFPVHAVAGLDPITLGDIAEYDDTIIPADVREEWLDEIIAEGSQQGSGGGGVTYLAMNVGRFGFQAGTSVASSADIGPGVARLLLFGNADGDTAIDVSAEASELDMAVLSTLAFSYAHPLTVTLGPLPDQHFSLGATLKYVVGHGLISGFDNGSSASENEVELIFPMIISAAPDSFVVDGDTVEAEEESSWNKGSGIGLDVGAVWQGGIFSAAVSIQNLMNTFAWNEDDMWYSPGQVLFDGDTTITNVESRPLSEAPDEVRQRLDDLAFPPTVAIAGAVQLPMVKVTGEVRHRPGESISLETATHVGVGAEFRPVPFLPIRAGVASLSGGYSLGAGLGVELGVFNLNVAANRRSTDLGTDVAGALTISFGGI